MRKKEWRIKVEPRKWGTVYRVQTLFFGFLWLNTHQLHRTERAAREWIEWAESDESTPYYIDV